MIDRRQHPRRHDDAEGPPPSTAYRVTIGFVCAHQPNLAETWFVMRVRQAAQALDGDISTLVMHVAPVREGDERA